MKTRLLIAAFLILISTISRAQTGVYKTYSDYVNGKMEKYDEMDYSINGWATILEFSYTNGKTVRLLPKNIWGFSSQGKLFRCNGDQVAMLTDTGKIYFYTNGYVELNKMGNRTSTWHPRNTSDFYLSAGLKGNLYLFAGTWSDKAFDSYAEFKKDFPRFKTFYDCIGKESNRAPELITTCLHNFNGTK